jgi:uncharacterized protein
VTGYGNVRADETMREHETLETKAGELVATQSTMALATARDGQAWAAPVYYVFYRGGFYFFSASDARHIAEAAESGQAAATIYPVVSSWQDIRGIQMAGQIKKVNPGLTAVQAVRAYIQKFPFVREFFDAGQDLDLENFGRRFRVRLYCFLPHQVYYLDNHIRFGFREAVTLKCAKASKVSKV